MSEKDTRRTAPADATTMRPPYAGGGKVASPIAGKARAGGGIGWLWAALGVMVFLPLTLVGIILWQGGMLGGNSGGRRLLSPGMTAPDFTLTAQDGRPFRLADYKGRAVFLAFVPSWADPKTVAEARSLKATAEQFDAAGAKVMLVSSGDSAAARLLHEGQKLPFPLLIDTKGNLSKLYTVPQGSDFRTTFVIDPKGEVKYRLTDAAVEAERHGPQLLTVSKCCLDDVIAARAHGIGKAVGDYSLPRADGSGMETLLGNSQQKATVVAFLSVRCPCSNAYNERLRDMARAYQAKDIRFVGVYANQDETAAEIAAHAKAQGFSFPALKDDRVLCADHFGASVTPEVFVLDASRTLRYAGRIDGSRDPAQAKTHELPDALDALLAGKLPNTGDTHAFGCGIVRGSTTN